MDLRHESGIARIVIIDIFLGIAKSCREGERLHAVFVHRLRLERPSLSESIIAKRFVVGYKQISIIGMCVSACRIGDEALALA